LSKPFAASFRCIDDTELPDALRPTAGDYAVWVQQQLATMHPGQEGIIRLRRPWPTAAFSPQDTTHPDYERIRRQADARGFEPVERGTGGRLTIFDENALAVTLVFPHAEPHSHTINRYEFLSGAIARALTALGIDARIGELPREFCPGRFSINAEGRTKIVGIAQRMNRKCVQMGAIISVSRSDKACAAIGEAYDAMGLDFDRATYGAINELRPAVTYAEVCMAVSDAIRDMVAD
jgi:octanoyl-[GcvH]:protein N-octanoyltransferase